LEQPAKVNGILIAQAGVGTDQIGRFDMVVDADTNSVDSYRWELVPISSERCPNDPGIERIIKGYRDQTTSKYDRVLLHLPRKLVHPNRYRETEWGDLICDALVSMLGNDVLLIGSGSIRKEEAGPTLTYGDLLELIPYDDKIIQLKSTGAQLKRMLAYMLREEAFDGEHTEFYQFSRGLRIVYSRARREFEVFELHGQPLADEQPVSFGLQGFHVLNFETGFGFALEELLADGETALHSSTLSTSLQDVLLECLSTNHELTTETDGRLTIK
jgi:5'-nucleotidase